MQHVKLRVRNATRTDLFHTWLVLLTPSVSEGLPVNNVAKRLQDPFRIAGNSMPPIDERTKDVEK